MKSKSKEFLFDPGFMQMPFPEVMPQYNFQQLQGPGPMPFYPPDQQFMAAQQQQQPVEQQASPSVVQSNVSVPLNSTLIQAIQNKTAETEEKGASTEGLIDLGDAEDPSNSTDIELKIKSLEKQIEVEEQKAAKAPVLA